MRRRSLSTPALPGAPWGWACAGGLLGLLLAGLLWLPAALLGWALAQASAGQIQLVQTSGTLWQGAATVLLSDGRAGASQALPSPLHWRLRPAGLGAQLELRSDCCLRQPLRLDWRAGLGTQRLRVADGHSQWPLALLAGLGAPWNTLGLQGQLQLRQQGLELVWSQGRLQSQGQASLELHNLSAALSTLPVLGSYRLQVLTGAVPGLELSTLHGELQLSGQGQWVQGRLRFRGQAQASEDREAALANLLSLIGQRNGKVTALSWG